MLAYRWVYMKWWAAVTVVAIPSQKELLTCPYVSSCTYSVLAPRFSRALLHNLHLASDRCLLFAIHLATGMLTPFFISSPEWAHLSPSTCKLLFVFLQLIFCCPSPCCIPHTITKCRMIILISCFPCFAARFSPREDCSICPLAPLFAYLRIWNSLIRQNVGSLIRWFSLMRFHFDQEGCCPCRNPLS